MQNIPLGCTRLALEMEQCVTAFPRPYMHLQMEMPEDVYQCGMQGYLFACLFCPIVYVRVIVFYNVAVRAEYKHNARFYGLLINTWGISAHFPTFLHIVLKS